MFSSDGVNVNTWSPGSEWISIGCGYVPTTNRFVFSFRSPVFDKILYGHGTSLSDITYQIANIPSNVYNGVFFPGMGRNIWDSFNNCLNSGLTKKYMNTEVVSQGGYVTYDGINWSPRGGYRLGTLHYLNGSSMQIDVNDTNNAGFAYVNGVEYSIKKVASSYSLTYSDNGLDWYEICGYHRPGDGSTYINDLPGTYFRGVIKYIQATNCIIFCSERYYIHKLDVTTHTITSINIPDLFVTSDYFDINYNATYDCYIFSGISQNVSIFINKEFKQFEYIKESSYTLLTQEVGGDKYLYIQSYNPSIAGVCQITAIQQPLSFVTKSVSGDVITITMNNDSKASFHMENTNSPLRFGMNAQIPEKLLIKKDMSFNTGVKINQNKAAEIWGAVAN